MPATEIHHQLVSVFRWWGMSEAHAATTAELMVETDLRGVDSHGISMLPTYDREFRAGQLNMRPVLKTVREAPATALIDADASLGHPCPPTRCTGPSTSASPAGVRRCRWSTPTISAPPAATADRRRSRRDRTGDSSTRGVIMVPTFAAEPVLGTNPLAFAAPARRNSPFELDMATTTVAAGKVKVYKLNHRPLPAGWVVDDGGRTVTDPEAAFRHVFERPRAASRRSAARARWAATRATASA